MGIVEGVAHFYPSVYIPEFLQCVKWLICSSAHLGVREIVCRLIKWWLSDSVVVYLHTNQMWLTFIIQGCPQEPWRQFNNYNYCTACLLVMHWWCSCRMLFLWRNTNRNINRNVCVHSCVLGYISSVKQDIIPRHGKWCINGPCVGGVLFRLKLQ